MEDGSSPARGSSPPKRAIPTRVNVPDPSRAANEPDLPQPQIKSATVHSLVFDLDPGSDIPQQQRNEECLTPGLHEAGPEPRPVPEPNELATSDREADEIIDDDDDSTSSSAWYPDTMVGNGRAVEADNAVLDNVPKSGKPSDALMSGLLSSNESAEWAERKLHELTGKFAMDHEDLDDVDGDEVEDLLEQWRRQRMFDDDVPPDNPSKDLSVQCSDVTSVQRADVSTATVQNMGITTVETPSAADQSTQTDVAGANIDDLYYGTHVHVAAQAAGSAESTSSTPSRRPPSSVPACGSDAPLRCDGECQTGLDAVSQVENR